MKYHIDTDKAVWRNIEGEIVILNLESGHYYGLNKTGSLVWVALCEKKDDKEIADKLCSRYSISRKNAEDDISTLLETLKKEGLISSMSG